MLPVEAAAQYKMIFFEFDESESEATGADDSATIQRDQLLVE